MENKPTLKLFYGLYDTCIKLKSIPLGYEFSYNRFSKDAHFPGWRGVKHIKRANSTYDCLVYTSSKHIIDDILKNDFLQSKIVSIQQPISAKHKDLLKKKDRKIILREALWFGKYKHRVQCSHNWDRPITKDESLEIVQWVYNNFKKAESRIVNTMGSYLGYHRKGDRLAPIPTIFTTNEETIMLFKLTFNDRLNINIETIVQVNDID
tara:strand:- start:1312 stop:1935 length:624 start_codon:yes stop_codon:yes gene_type:complete